MGFGDKEELLVLMRNQGLSKFWLKITPHKKSRSQTNENGFYLLSRSFVTLDVLQSAQQIRQAFLRVTKEHEGVVWIE